MTALVINDGRHSERTGKPQVSAVGFASRHLQSHLQMKSCLNRVRALRILALALLVPFVAPAQTNPKPASSDQTKQQKKAEAARNNEASPATTRPMPDGFGSAKKCIILFLYGSPSQNYRLGAQNRNVLRYLFY